MEAPASTVITIVGHGLSPVGKKWGSRIDETVVVRMKDASWQSAEDYGSRVDYMASSTEILPVMLDYKRVPKEYWAQPKKGKWSAVTEANFRSRAKAPLRIPLQLFLTWNAVFKSFHDGDVPNFSLGVFAIICAAEFLKPEEIRLVGFDNLLDPNKLDYHKANKGKWPTRHDWHAEKRMLPEIEKAYGVIIRAWK
jgi:hypothetical protein